MTDKKKQKSLGAQRLTPGLIDAISKLEALVRDHGLKVLPDRAVEVVGAGAPTRAKLLEAAVRMLLEDAIQKVKPELPVTTITREEALKKARETEEALKKALGEMPSNPNPRPLSPNRMVTVMYGGAPTLEDPTPHRVWWGDATTTSGGASPFVTAPRNTTLSGGGDGGSIIPEEPPKKDGES